MRPQRPTAVGAPEEVIRLLTVAVRNLSMYTSQHPAFLRTMDQLVDTIRAITAERERFSVSVVRDQLLVDQRVPVLGPVAQGFANDLVRRGVRGISIAREVTRAELTALVEILARRPEEVLHEGSYEEILKGRGVTRIWIHPLRDTGLGDERGISGVLLDRFLLGQLQGEEASDALRDLLFNDPEGIRRAVSERAVSEGRDDEERARWASERLVVLMEQLLAGHPQEWDLFKDRLATLILSLGVETQAEFFRQAIVREGETRFQAQRLAEALPRESLAEIVSKELASARGIDEKGKFVRGLLPDAAKRRDLLPEVERKLQEYGVPKEEFLKLLMEGEPSVEERLDRFLKGHLVLPDDMTYAAELVNALGAQGRKEEALKVAHRFFNALNHPEWEVRKAVASTVGSMFQALEGADAPEATVRKIRDFALRKMLGEPDKEVFRLLAEGLEDVARGELRKGDGGGEAVDFLLRILSSLAVSDLDRDYVAERREKVREELSRESVVDRAVRDLSEGTPAEFKRALEIIRLVGGRGVDRVVETLGQERQMSKRLRLFRALTELGEVALEPLRKSLLDPRWYLVRNAVKVLSDLKDARSVPSFLGLLAHPEARVRREVVQALGRIATPRAQEGVLKALDDPDEGVRARAVEVLQALGGPKARERLRAVAARSTGLGPRDSAVRIKALRALGVLGQEEDVPLLEALLTRKGLFSRMETEEVRRVAVSALSGILERLQSSRALRVLQGVARSDPAEEIRRSAEEAVAPFLTATPQEK
jgi:HEAT repeat protein